MYNELENEYVNWIFDLLSGFRGIKVKKYTNLLWHLFRKDFTYILPMDENRAEDGVCLRYRFGYLFNHPRHEIDSFLNYGNSSILEMMVALAVRCEEQIMDDPEFGDRTSKWFWTMIHNLGLLEMTNENYDERLIDDILERFLKREYEPNGEGGLFVVNHSMRDMRKTEIWYQLCWFINENEM